MPVFRAAIATSLLLAGMPGASHAQEPAVEHPGVGPVVVETQSDRSRRMTVPVTIEGQGPFRFLVDTGSQATVVTPRVTTALGLLPTGRAILVAMASRTPVETVTLDGLEFAGRRYGNLTAPLLRDRDIGADGIIGLDSLQDLRIVIDFRDETLSLSDSPRGNDGYEIIVRARRKFGQMIITDATVDGVRTAVVIDTGSWHSIGNDALRRRLRNRNGETVTAQDVTGAELKSNLAVVDALRIGDMGLSGVPVGFSDSPAFAALGLAAKPALILGLGNLRPFDRVAIDFASRKILFDVSKADEPSRLDALFNRVRIGTP